MKRNRVRRTLSSPRPGPGEDSIYVSTNRRLCLVSVIEWEPWCLVLTSSGLKFQLMGGGTWHCGPLCTYTRPLSAGHPDSDIGPVFDVRTLNPCTHWRGLVIAYSSVDSCVVPLLILGWGDNVIELETKVKRRFAKVSIV